MAGTILNPPPVPLVDENRRITRGWLYALLAMSKTLVSGTVTGPASSTTGAIATYADTTGALLSQLTGSGVVLETANVASVIPLPADATKFLNGVGAFAVPAGSVLFQGPTRVFTNAQIKALPTTALDLVAAQGASTRIVLWAVDLVADCSASGYTNVNADGFVYASLPSFEGQSNLIANDSTIPTTHLTDLLTIGRRRVLLTPYTNAEPVNVWGNLADVQTLSAGSVNAPFSLFADNNGAGNFTGGNAANTLTATTYYTVVSD